MTSHVRFPVSAEIRGAGAQTTLNGMKLCLDDIRPCPDGYTHARSVNEAVKLLEQGVYTYASLDHNLGDFAEDGGGAD